MGRIGEKDPSLFKDGRSPLEYLPCTRHYFFQDGTYLAQLCLRFLGSSFDVFVNRSWFRFRHGSTSIFIIIYDTPHFTMRYAPSASKITPNILVRSISTRCTFKIPK